MLDVSEAERRAANLVERAVKAGADAADVLYFGDLSTSVQVRLGELEAALAPEIEQARDWVERNAGDVGAVVERIRGASLGG